MVEKAFQIINIQDGQEIDQQIVEEFEINELCSDKKYNFVGFINKRDKILISCPKHFEYRDQEDIKLIIKCIIKSFRDSDMGSVERIDCNIPFDAYLHIVDYYYKYGIYKQTSVKYKQGYSGNVDWNRTIRRSPKALSGKNIVYLPFEIRETIRENTFIGECMQYVLNDGYEQFGKFIGIGEKIDTKGFSFNFNNSDAIIKMLRGEEERHFKDSELQLIYALIAYFSWDGSLTDKSFLITQSFDLSWENMVQFYLNENFYDYDEKNQKMIFVNGCKRFGFRKKSDNVESSGKHNHGFHVEYDHLYEDINKEKLLVFDSKYYSKISELNYKQVAYHYFLMNTSSNMKRDAKNIINGLILPTEGNYYSKIHVDRSDIDGVYIQEHYINVREIMMNYI